MKKILSAILAVVMLCSCFVFTASSASADEGVNFKDQRFMYAVEEDLPSEPLTVEATLFFNKRIGKYADGGTFFGNYHWDATSHNLDFGIQGGAPVIRVRNDDNVYTYQFNSVDVYQTEWIHVTLVRDVEKKEARCYINGELAETLPMTETYKPLATWDFKIGANMAYMNPDYFIGALKSLAVYSDVRTDAEIKKDVNTLDKSGLMVAYDFTGKNDRPAVVEDLSGNGNNAVQNRMFYDDAIVDPSTYAYTFAVLGDTQSMAVNFPDHFKDMYNFIYDNIETMNIEAVLGLGDITDTKTGVEGEWNIALEGHKIIDDVVLNIPITGDHDNPFWYNKMMAQLNYAEFATLYKDKDYRDGYYATEIGGIPYLFIQFCKGPDDATLNWANNVVAAHPGHNVIVTTHAYLHHDRTTLSAEDPHLTGMSNLADAMWDKFVSKHENIVMVLSGHIGHDYVVVNQRQGEKGNTVTEMLLDFQSVDNAARNYNLSKDGVGVVNMFHFSEDGKTLTIETFSTVLGKKFMDLNQFTIQLDPASDKKYVKPTKAPIPPRVEVDDTVEIKMTVDNMTAYVNGTATTLDAAPVIRNDRTMLPVRFVAENLGATVGWNANTQTVTIEAVGKKIEITIGSNFAKVNGGNIVLDSPAYIDAATSRTYLPVRAVAENLGATVSWDAATRTATLTK